MKKHGHRTRLKRTKEYTAWVNMKDRCYNPNHKYYKDYGARGIGVCEKWRTNFNSFLSDVGNAPSSKHTLDRFPNNNGNYEPLNCRWATVSEQMLNRRPRTAIEFNGEIKSIAEWARIIGVGSETIKNRLKKGIALNLFIRKKYAKK